MSNSLIAIGYWHSPTQDLPDPGAFVDHSWDAAERDMVAEYLKKGVTLMQYRGFSWCRFKCGITTNGTKDFSDGTYVWPEGLAHYVEEHCVRLPEEFIEHVKQHQEGNPLASVKNPEDKDWVANGSWWSRQRGTSPSPVQTSRIP